MVLGLLRQIGCIYWIGKTDDSDPCDGGTFIHPSLSKAQIDNYSEEATQLQRCPDVGQLWTKQYRRAFDGNIPIDLIHRIWR